MTPEQHRRSTLLVRASLLALPIKPEPIRPEVEMHVWAMGIKR